LAAFALKTDELAKGAAAETLFQMAMMAKTMAAANAAEPTETMTIPKVLRAGLETKTPF